MNLYMIMKQRIKEVKNMREGIELELYNKLQELLPKYKHPKWAVDELDYLIFIKQ